MNENLNEEYPLYIPPPETLDDYINLIISMGYTWSTPLIVSGLFVWLIFRKYHDKK